MSSPGSGASVIDCRLRGAAEADRLREQLAEAESGTALGDAEAEVVEQLAQIRAAVAGQINAPANVEAVRAALERLFDRFLFHPELPANAHVELIGSRYWIEPVLSERAIEGYDEKMQPILVREPLGQATNNYAQTSPCRYLFAPIPLGGPSPWKDG